MRVLSHRRTQIFTDEGRGESFEVAFSMEELILGNPKRQRGTRQNRFVLADAFGFPEFASLSV